MTEQPLPGGLDSGGTVVRVGDTVRRPGGSNAEPVRLLLGHLARAGFTAAPRFLGLDSRGREVLDFLPGDVAVPPYPDWAADEELLLSVAALQSALHSAAAGFTLPSGMSWATRTLPPGAEGELVCHTDLCLENVVVRDGRAAAFIDFDLALPVDRLFDIAVAARHWIPLRDPADITDARAGTDLSRRFALFADVHELSTDDRRRVVELLIGFLDVALADIREKAAAGHPGYAPMWADGYEPMNRRSREWLLSFLPGRDTAARSGT
ncbi:phosphotransferase [Actinoplanes friuliensis]|uniref:Aminoglycoside phosphotransferase n=1 Tax=Actinoplanes friuliensis DSM 7358 TaxID=1246995 RepID=U5W4A4_9ACTN|nr:phosphotransferase [Actinoplanes friuliensis]AGZ42746.1 aminoglycoside phosphotransferase [Actinoplanes friuliensis DSM 7358]